MAYSLAKKVAVRAARLTDDLLALRTHCGGDAAELRQLESCIAEARASAARMADVFTDYRPAAPAPRRAPPAAPVYTGPPVVPPVYGPSTGVYEAQPRKPKHWAVAGTMQDKQDDDDNLVFLPHDSTPAMYVQQCLDGLRAPTLCEAAKLLAADASTWALLDDDERVAAIDRKALEIEAADPLGEGTPAPAPAPADGVTF